MNKIGHFEKSLDELESIVAQLEQGHLSLETALKQFEKGIGLAQKCQAALTQAEQKINILTSNQIIENSSVDHE